MERTTMVISDHGGIKVGLHCKLDRRMSAIQDIYDGRGNFNGGSVERVARLLATLWLRYQRDRRSQRLHHQSNPRKSYKSGYTINTIVVSR